MSWYAPTKIEEALNETKDFLTPFNMGLWASLAVLVFFMNGGLSGLNPPTGGTGNTNTGATLSDANIASSVPQFTADIHNSLGTQNLATGAFNMGTGATASVIVLIAAVAIIFTVLSAMARFSYFQAVMEKKVGIRRLFRDNFRNAMQYIGFTFLLLIIAVLPVLPILAGASEAVSIISLIAGAIIWLFMGISLMFISDFGIPLMISEEMNIIEAARRSLSLVWAEKGQAAVYFVTKVAIGIALGILALVASLVVLLALLIPFGILGILGYMIAPALGLAVLGGGLLVFFVINLFVKVPVMVYKHYFFVLNLEEFADLELVEK